MGMWNRPGTTETRKVTLKDEIARILICCGLSILFVILIVAIFLFEAMIVGPLLGVVIGLVAIIMLVFWQVSPLIYDLDPERWRSYTLSFVLASATSWWLISYPLLNSIWPPRLPWVLPVWASLLILVISFSAQTILGAGLYLLSSEAFDPNGPTSTRKPVEYPHSIFPWTRVNPVEDKPVDPVIRPRLVRIHHERENSRGFARNRDLVLPDTPAWHQYARALANRVTSFSENSAKGFGISPQDKRDRVTHQVTEIGFRTVRDLLKARGYITLVNEQAPNMGYRFEDDFYELMDEWGAMEDDAPTQQDE